VPKKKREGGKAPSSINDSSPHGSSAPPTSRATVRPTFDPNLFAAESEIRERATTVTDEAELEAARLKSLPSAPPPRRPSMTSDVAEIAAAEAEVSDEEQIAILRERLHPLSRVPSLAKKMSDLGKHVEDPRTAFVLGFVDGLLPLDTIVEVTGLPELDTLEILDRLVEANIIVFRPRKT